MRTPASITTAVHLLFFLSGAAGLVYQIVWMRMLILVFGGTALAVSTVLTAFMSGLALGAYLFGRWADRWSRPLVVYGLLEIGIGVYAVAVPALMSGVVPVYAWIWNRFEPGPTEFSLLKFAGSLSLLLIPTTLMGGTLPVLARWVARSPAVTGMRVGVLYATNTFGAVAGTFACGFLLIRVLGMQWTILGAASVNVLLGLVALTVAARRGVLPMAVQAAPASPGLAAGSSVRAAVLVVYGLSGFVALVLEVAWTRVLTLIIGGSVYAFALMLTAFLAGLAGGAAALAPVADAAGPRRGLLLAGLLSGAGLAALGTVWAFGSLPYVFAVLLRGLFEHHVIVTLLELGICTLVMVPATFLLGGIFPVAVRMMATHEGRIGEVVGKVYAANTAGTIAGAFAGGFLLIPWLGLQGTVSSMGALEILLGLAVLATVPALTARRRLVAVTVLILAAVLVVALQPRWNPLLMNSGVYIYAQELPEGFDRQAFREFAETGYREVYYEEGTSASVLVGEEVGNGNLFLAVNGKVDASSSGDDMITQILIAQLPLLFHPRPRDVLVVGLASGVTAGSVLTHPVESMDAVEIEAAVVRASAFFESVNNRPLGDPRARVMINDGRNHLLYTPRRYDVIISAPSNPWLTGASNLFTVEYFRMVKEHLQPDGIACQWLQSYSIGVDDLKSLLASFGAMFRHLLVFNPHGADLIVLGSQSPMHFDLTAMEGRMGALNVAMDLARIDVRNPEDLVAWLVTGEAELAPWLTGAGANTDDNARVEFSAPWTLYDPTVKINTQALAEHAASPEAYLTTPLSSTSRRARFYRRLASALARREAYDRALAMVERAIEIAPDDESLALKAFIQERARG